MILFLLVALYINGTFVPMDAFATFEECTTAYEEVATNEKKMTKESKINTIHSYKCIGVQR